MPMAHAEVRSPKVFKSTSPFSHATLTTGTRFLHVTGQAAQGPDGQLVGRGDITRQTVQALENLKALVEAAGGTLADVARLRIYLTTRDHLAPVKAVRRQYFREPYPATTVIQVAGLDDPEWLVEIEATAVLP
jgi:enamine deaminase RidA (YjgF/YER057c/UK114 family)